MNEYNTKLIEDKNSNEKIKDDYNILNDKYNKLIEENNELKKQIENNKSKFIEKKEEKINPTSYSIKPKKIIINETNKDEVNNKEKQNDGNRNNNVLFKSMKVSSIAQQLESVLNRPKTMVNDTEKKDETPIKHNTVDLSNTDTGNTISYGGGSRRKRAKKNFQDN